MKLRELNIGDTFFIGCGITIWRKKTIQGVNDAYSYCESLDYKQTRCPEKLSKWGKLFSQELEVHLYERNIDITYNEIKRNVESEVKG